MEGTVQTGQGSHSNGGERSRMTSLAGLSHNPSHYGVTAAAPQYSRASSRSSNATTNTRMTPHSNNSSSTNLGSPKKSHSQRLHNTSRASTSIERPRSTLSKEGTDGSGRPDPSEGAPTISTYLQEKLHRERRFESERSASRAGGGDMGASVELRAVQSSPVRASTSDGRRPRSSGGADLAKKKGLGLKDMEQTLSKLHKDNFDLKFEVFHRREKQTELEARVHILESDLETLRTAKAETEDINDRLMEELQKRDKAVEEAVAMIIMLEDSLEGLRRERDAASRVEARGHHPFSDVGSSDQHTPRSKMPSLSRKPELQPEDSEAHRLARMPSFMSDRSGNTENLRSLYIGSHGSILSFRRALDNIDDEDMGHLNGMSTPSLSVLSESSFLSVYGQTKAPNSSSSPPDLSDAAMRHDSYENRSQMRKPPISNRTSVTPTKPRRSSSVSRNPPSGTYSSLHDVLGGSPLQRLERLQMDDDQSIPIVPSDLSAASGGSSSNQQGNSEPQLPTLSRDQPKTRSKTKQEKRDALRKVLTDAPRELTNTFPPTPDTISTSTLRRYKNSNDTLSQPPQAGPKERSYLAPSESATSRSTSREASSIDAHAPAFANAPSTSAFASMRDAFSSGAGTYFDNRLPIPQRPRSAGETTTSHDRRGANGWATDSSEDDLDDGASVSSSCDYWMREGLKPNRRFPHNGAALAPRAGPGTGRASPDLFSFPSSTGAGWASDAMFGSLGGSGFLGATAPTSQALDALGDSLPTPQAGLFGSGLASPALPGTAFVPPPPRRSSLHARTGSTSATAAASPSSTGGPAATAPRPGPANGKLRKSPVRGGSGSSQSRSNSFDSNVPAGRAIPQAPPTVSAQQHQPQQPCTLPPAAEPPKRHYPPISGQQQAPRRSGGLNSLFRRSLGGSTSENAPPRAAAASAPPAETTFKSAYPPPPSPAHPPQPQLQSSRAPQQQQHQQRNGTVPPPLQPMVGVPTSWGRRGDLRGPSSALDDDPLSSATPPPIMRNPRGGRRPAPSEPPSVLSSSFEHVGDGPDEQGGGASLLQQLPPQESFAAQQQQVDPAAPSPTSNGGGNPGGGGGRMRTWLGLGRVGSMRNRAG